MERSESDSQLETRAGIASLRARYLSESESWEDDDLVSKEPFKNFDAWMKKAIEEPQVVEPNAMCLATSTEDGKPSARYVLLKGYGKDGFRFYTNYQSRKARELLSNPQAALVFYWEALHRSIRIEGRVEKLSEDESTRYFQSRPFNSQIGSCASDQSQVIRDREVLVKRYQELHKEFKGQSQIPRPPHWGGFILVPELVEFWQGQTNRLHDRIVFKRFRNGEVLDQNLTHRGDDGWVYERLSP